MNNITRIQLALLILQVSSLMYCLFTGSNPLYTHTGFSMWGLLPILALNFLHTTRN